MKTRVVHVLTAPYDIYIGGYVAATRSHRQFNRSRFENPYRPGADGNALQVVETFRRYLRTRPDLVQAARQELVGKVLGCWCKGRDGKNVPCHGDVLAAIANDDQEWRSV
jgi:hypothetical protein